MDRIRDERRRRLRKLSKSATALMPVTAHRVRLSVSLSVCLSNQRVLDGLCGEYSPYLKNSVEICNLNTLVVNFLHTRMH